MEHDTQIEITPQQQISDVIGILEQLEGLNRRQTKQLEPAILVLENLLWDLINFNK